MEYVARISHGKDSLKMLDVIVSRGLPLDRITTTDIWATETIRGEHPKMVEFKEMADEYIWRKYHIEVEHLCAMKDGKKITYEKMFYHIPKRKDKDPAGGGQFGDKEQSSVSPLSGGLGARNHSRYEGLPAGFPVRKGAWCQKLKHRWVPNLFPAAPPRGAVEISWNTSESQPMSRIGSAS